MKTHILGHIPHGKAFQEVFMRTGMPMLPRWTNVGWVYDEAEQSDVERACRASIFTKEEILAIYLLCNEERYNPFLWHKLAIMIQLLPNNKRFWQNTLVQPMAIAQAFYYLTMCRSTNN